MSGIPLPLRAKTITAIKANKIVVDNVKRRVKNVCLMISFMFTVLTLLLFEGVFVHTPLSDIETANE